MMAERQRPSGKKQRAAKPAAAKPAPASQSELLEDAAPKTEAPGNASSPPPDPSARIRALESERDKFAAELAVAKARIEALEQAREQVLNRIDWVIDSLHSLTSE